MEVTTLQNDLMRVGARTRLQEIDSERAMIMKLLNGDGKAVEREAILANAREAATDAAPRRGRKKGGRTPLTDEQKAERSRYMKRYWARKRKEAAGK